MDQARRTFFVRSALGCAAVVTAGLGSRVGFAQNPHQAATPPDFAPTGLWDVGPGKKFSANGKAQPFPGNTVICRITATNPVFAELCAAYEALRASTGSENLAWLPASSYHSTIFDGAANASRTPGD